MLGLSGLRNVPVKARLKEALGRMFDAAIRIFDPMQCVPRPIPVIENYDSTNAHITALAIMDHKVHD
jgi:hypothetical protein